MWDFSWGVFWALVAAGITLWTLRLCFVAIYNFSQRASALRLLKQPFSPTPRADLLKAAREILGPGASMQDLEAIADDLEQHAGKA